MPSSFFSRLSSEIFSISVALFTWYGSSVMMIASRPPRSFSECALARRVMVPSPRRVGLADAGGAVDVAGRREIGARDDPGERLDRGLWLFDQGHQAIDDFREIVGRDVRGHADRDAGRTVHDQVGDTRRQDDRLRLVVVVVGGEVDGVLVDVGQHLVGDPGHAGFGITHGGGRVAVDGAEVPLPVHERVAQREVLHHPHERVVDGRVTVGVELAHAVADHAGRLLVATVEGEAEQRHRVEHPAMHGLEAVTDVGQRASDDDGHRVVQVRLPHLLFDRRVDLAVRHLGQATHVSRRARAPFKYPGWPRRARASR
jgi:hypothetical protein